MAQGQAQRRPRHRGRGHGSTARHPRFTLVVDSKSNSTHWTGADLLRQAGHEVKEKEKLIIRKELFDGLQSWQYKVRRFGWGFGTNSKTVRFSIGILLIHSLVAIIYIASEVIHYARRRWSRDAWESIGDIMALAWLSRAPPQLRNAGGGIGKWDTWKLNMAIRPRDDERVELVVNKPEWDYSGKPKERFIVDKKYS